MREQLKRLKQYLKATEDRSDQIHFIAGRDGGELRRSDLRALVAVLESSEVEAKQ